MDHSICICRTSTAYYVQHHTAIYSRKSFTLIEDFNFSKHCSSSFLLRRCCDNQLLFRQSMSTRSSPHRRASREGEDDCEQLINPDVFPKVTKIISSTPISQQAAFEMLTKFLSDEKDKDMNTLRRRRLEKIYQIGERVALNDSDRSKLRSVWKEEHAPQTAMLADLGSVITEKTATLAASPSGQPISKVELNSKEQKLSRQQRKEQKKAEKEARKKEKKEAKRVKREAKLAKKEAKKAKKEIKRVKKEAKKVKKEVKY